MLANAPILYSVKTRGFQGVSNENIGQKWVKVKSQPFTVIKGKINLWKVNCGKVHTSINVKSSALKVITTHTYRMRFFKLFCLYFRKRLRSFQYLRPFFDSCFWKWFADNFDKYNQKLNWFNAGQFSFLYPPKALVFYYFQGVRNGIFSWNGLTY